MQLFLQECKYNKKLPKKNLNLAKRNDKSALTTSVMQFYAKKIANFE